MTKALSLSEVFTFTVPTWTRFWRFIMHRLLIFIKDVWVWCSFVWPSWFAFLVKACFTSLLILFRLSWKGLIVCWTESILIMSFCPSIQLSTDYLHWVFFLFYEGGIESMIDFIFFAYQVFQFVLLWIKYFVRTCPRWLYALRCYGDGKDFRFSWDNQCTGWVSRNTCHGLRRSFKYLNWDIE